MWMNVFYGFCDDAAADEDDDDGDVSGRAVVYE